MNLPPLEASELCLSKPHAIPEIQSMAWVQELQGGAVLRYFLTSMRRHFPHQNSKFFFFFIFNVHNEIHSFSQFQPVYFSRSQEITASLYQ